MNRSAYVLATSAVLLGANVGQAAYTGLTCEEYVGEGWLENGFGATGLTAIRVYATFDGNGPDDGVLSVCGLCVNSSDGVFHNDEVFGSNTAPLDLTPAIWSNCWDTYVTINATQAEGDATSLTPGFPSATNDLGGSWSSDIACWFVTENDSQSMADANNRVLLAQFVVAQGVEISGELDLYLLDGTTVNEEPLCTGSCGESCEVAPVECCGGIPEFLSELAPSFGAGPIAVITNYDVSLGTSPALRIFDLSDQGIAPLNMDWRPPNYAGPVDDSWSFNNLGTVFGLALDGDGNIYVAHGSSFGRFGLPDSTGGQGVGGTIFKIDTNSAAPTVLTALPNVTDPVYPSNPWPGIGSLSFDCERSMLYASNFEDGKIYRIDPVAGTILSAFDHGIPDDGLDGFCPLGERIWAVEVFNGRLYYSLWWEDFGRERPPVPPNPPRDYSHANDVWSIACDASGEFILGTERREISMALHPFDGEPFEHAGEEYSSPISDISFSPDGKMLLTERHMENDTVPFAHAARALEFECIDGAWTLLDEDKFTVGFQAGRTDASGGGDYDFGPNGRVWVTGDALHFVPPHTDYIYGIQGLPASGGGIADSILIDADYETAQQNDKSDQGEIEISCPVCVDVDPGQILCTLDDTGDITYTFTITNNSGIVGEYLLFASPDIEPTSYELDSVPGNGGTATVTITISNATPGGEFCFDMVLLDGTGNACCPQLSHCLDVPECDCGQIRPTLIGCEGDDFFVFFNLDNLFHSDIYHAWLIPPDGSDIMVSPGYYDLGGPLAPNDSIGLGATISGAMPGEEICFLVTTHIESFEQCCGFEWCITAPDCPLAVCTGDCNGDGSVSFADLNLLLANWGPCEACQEDLDEDGAVNFGDMLLLLSNWGPCE